MFLIVYLDRSPAPGWRVIFNTLEAARQHVRARCPETIFVGLAGVLDWPASIWPGASQGQPLSCYFTQQVIHNSVQHTNMWLFASIVYLGPFSPGTRVRPKNIRFEPFDVEKKKKWNGAWGVVLRIVDRDYVHVLWNFDEIRLEDVNMLRAITS